ncbi:GNAT family N-acetyltransferase [Streptomyces sp. WAC05374]|uniref:bifunctional class I SAM-dependent methyltransferase/N-acetyltransferase n=1 Tax=Streptomyces sp. WAC05374 TaxID=2487420 RepID=UPI000F881AAA|nr:bifunctional class I SAM-dependent methyltransferase/N-acetyltransferase [Streptomyces sp. WAC05374]RST18293.1 GNAT family N-acetyltransferase [Streptomyces sp. WAC05374]TDF45908.1 GNAT family N-acetyltransferase [Streptomyces sp. WAC05374]TDF48082.1 GNAT family N-acetyltransferase [Streptomyces sp. WAC05374]TDF52903.1 GNAT family N-acetyltransferase [Streptomyces sp. WAC05374]
MSDNALYDAFFALHHGLPRQGPGSDDTTRRLLAPASLAGPLPERPRVLDLGCGPGRSALLLAAEAGAGGGRVTAVDLHEPFLDELRRAARERGLADAVRTVRADMAELPYPDGSFDLVWAESSAYSIGFDRALASWRRLLAPGGTLVVTECEWTADDPSPAARAFWDRHYPLRTTAANTAAAVAAGYHVIGTYRQPESDWEEYYGPLAERAAAADPAAPGMGEALAATRAEIALRREHGTEYGYTGYVLRPADPRWRTRPETDADTGAVRALNTAAFGTDAEARLVDELRRDRSAWLPGLSYVAEAPDGTVAAYALVTRCRVGDEPAAALAPVAVAPAHQRQGAGRAVVRAVLDAARLAGERLVLVLGHPEYYPAFGFAPASRYGIRPAFDVPDEAMMALDLDGCGQVPTGTIHYPPAFGV